MTQQRRGKFKCVACGRITVQPINEDHPNHEIRSWCCCCSFERVYDDEREAKLTQDLGWIRVFAEGMNVDNWLDMRERIIRQLNQARVGVGETVPPPRLENGETK